MGMKTTVDTTRHVVIPASLPDVVADNRRPFLSATDDTRVKTPAELLKELRTRQE
jgi:hypothetical protein